MKNLFTGILIGGAILFFLVIIFSLNEARKAPNKEVVYFKANKTEILSQINKYLEEKDFLNAEILLATYQVSGDPDLLDLDRKVQTDSLLYALKSTDKDDYHALKVTYKQLIGIHPSNRKYQTNYRIYNNKYIKQQKEINRKENRKQEIASQFSSWDGSHYNLETVIKQSMNDPKSYKHVRTWYWDKGDYLEVTTTFRGKNAFGGIVKNSITAKVTIQGLVSEIISQGAI